MTFYEWLAAGVFAFIVFLIPAIRVFFVLKGTSRKKKNTEIICEQCLYTFSPESEHVNIFSGGPRRKQILVDCPNCRRWTSGKEQVTYYS